MEEKEMIRSVLPEIFWERLAEEVRQAEEGEINPLTLWGDLNRWEKELKAVKTQIENLARQEAELYPEKSFKLGKYSFEKRNGGYSYSYKEIPQWIDLKEEMQKVEMSAKAAFDLFQKSGSRPISEDGELLPMPDVTPRKDSLVVKLVK